MPEAARPLDFIALGRAAVDLYGEQIGSRLEDMSSFAKYVGGCPANISVGAARLGLKPAMITRVGDEHMGRFVRETLAAEGVDVSHVRTDPVRPTGLVILGIRDRETFPLLFFRDNCADMAIVAEDFEPAFIASARALVVTGTHFSTPGTDFASRTAIRHARGAGTRVVFDIDYRPVLWGLTGRDAGENRFVASQTVTRHLQSIVPHCDLIVGTAEEIHIAGGDTDTLEALRSLRVLSRGVIVLKLGEHGCAVFPGAIPERIEEGVVHPGFPVEVFNVLGAGDAFLAGLLRGWLSGLTWLESAGIANACGALVVSRHGCAPAMPSWTELQDFLTRFDNPEQQGLLRLYQDEGLAQLHRTTTARKPWPQVCALAFDHRRQFEALADRHGASHERIAAFKTLVARALMRAAPEVPGAGAIVDDRYGQDVLFALGGRRLWLARALEQSGVTPLAFEHGPDPAITLRSWPAEQVVKVLVNWRPGAQAELLAQEAAVATAFRACVATGHELLLEVIIAGSLPGEDGGSVLAALERFYAAGIRPDWWKLPPLRDTAAWCALGDAIRAHDAHCRGVLVLGQEMSDEQLAAAFRAAAAEPLVRGFAVGRSLFWQAAKEWFACGMDDEEAMRRIADNYLRIATLWRDRLEQ